MTNNADAQIAREWAETNANAVTPTPLTLDQRNAITRHILATTTPPTMDNIDWDDEVHTGMCALYADGDVVRMIGPDPAPGEEGSIICHWVYYDSPVTGRLPAERLTPIPGTRVDLTPRRVDSDEAPSTRDESVPRPEDVKPEQASTHPATLVTEEDYRNAPKGTVVAMSAEAWTKTTENEWSDPTGRVDDKYMSSSARRVLRWGWSA